MADQHDHVEPQGFDLGNMIAQLQGLAGQLQGLASQRPPPSPRADEVPSKERSAPSAEGSLAPVAVPAETTVAPAAQNATSPGSPPAMAAAARPADQPSGGACACGATGAANLVAPSQAPPPGLRAPQENEFVTYQNSQLVFTTGQLSYDFGTEARRDYFVQQFQYAFHDDRLRNAANVQEGNIPLPENYKAMAVYLAADRIDPQYATHRADANAIIWTLTIDAIPIYEIRPVGNFDVLIFLTLIGLLEQTADGAVDRVFIAGRIIGSKRLYNGSSVPSVDPTLRGMYSWRSKKLVDSVIEALKDSGEELDEDTEKRVGDRLAKFLDRVYYELGKKAFGQAPDERALNFLSTNAFDVGEVFVDAASENLELENIIAEQSTICRPESLCYDVKLTFFNPKKRRSVWGSTMKRKGNKR